MANDQTTGMNTGTDAAEIKPKIIVASAISDPVDGARIIEEAVIEPAVIPESKTIPSAPSSAGHETPLTPDNNAVEKLQAVSASIFVASTPIHSAPTALTPPNTKLIEKVPEAEQKSTSLDAHTPLPVRNVDPPKNQLKILKRSSSSDEKTDIENILKEIKLPERHTPSGESSVPIKGIAYDTSISEKQNREIREQPISNTSSNAERPTSESSTESSTASDKQGASIEDRDVSKVKKESLEDVSSTVTPIRTLKNDFQDIVRDKKISLVRAASLEQDKKRDARPRALGVTIERKHRTFNIVFASVLLAGLGTAAFFGAALIIRERSSTVEVPTNTSLLFSESEFPLALKDLSSFDIKNLFNQIRSGSGATLGSITRIVPIVPVTANSDSTARTTEERPATLEEFLNALGTHVSPDLIRALDTEFFFGIHTVDENAPFFVIPVASYERAFAGMLEWETTMNADLAPAFTPVPNTVMGGDGLLAKRQFEDVVMRNYDVRAFKDDNSEIQLYYSFPTRNILIVAESPYSFTEVLSRLRAERKL